MTDSRQTGPYAVETPPADVPVRSSPAATVAMVVVAGFMDLLQVSFTAQQTNPSSGYHLWLVFSTLVALVSGFLLCGRSDYPEATFWLSCLVVTVFPFDGIMALMALAALLARRDDRRRNAWAIVAGGAVCTFTQVRDVLRGSERSVWQLLFAQPHTGPQYGTPLVVDVSLPVMLATAVVAALLTTALSVLAGLHVRQRAIVRSARARADAAAGQAATLRQDLDAQQFADAVAAEAHDTLAHSLSLLALNASALQGTVRRLETSLPATARDGADVGTLHEEMRTLSATAQDIRRQAAGALDEAHGIIDTLRHPEQAAALFEPSQDTSLTRASLDALVGDARAAGMHIDTWIDVRDLGSLDRQVGKVAYRVIQEGLTNARRHAPGASVSLQLDAAPDLGIHIHVANPTVPSAGADVAASAGMPAGTAASTDDARTGEGLRGLAARVRQAHGVCSAGTDDRRVFHLDVTLPWTGVPNEGPRMHADR